MDSLSNNSGRQPGANLRNGTVRQQQPHPHPQSAGAQPASHAYAGAGSKKPKMKRGKLWAIITAALVIVILGAGYWGYNALMQGRLIDSSKYQAVFLTNGQVYFGKLSRVGSDTYKLNKIFYLQASQTESSDANNPQKTSSSNSDVQLIKLGSEVHGPDDQMVIDKGQVLFYENLTKEGKVAKTIEQYYADKK